MKKGLGRCQRLQHGDAHYSADYRSPALTAKTATFTAVYSLHHALCTIEQCPFDLRPIPVNLGDGRQDRGIMIVITHSPFAGLPSIIRRLRLLLFLLKALLLRWPRATSTFSKHLFFHAA